MRGDAECDVIVIGGGHNGLITAAYLALGGRRVVVVERREVLGGCCVTESPWPGYRVNTAADTVSLLSPEIVRELKLQQYGLQFLPRASAWFTPLLDGRSLLLPSDVRRASRALAAFSPRDAEAYPQFVAWLERVAQALRPLFADTAPDPVALAQGRRRLGMAKRFRDQARQRDWNRVCEELGEQFPEALELLTGSLRSVLRRWFESEALRATLAAEALHGVFQSAYAPGTAWGLVRAALGQAGGPRGGRCLVRGGMGQIATSLAQACTDLRVEVRTGAEVKRILVHQGRVRGVALASGEVLSAPVVASSLDARWTCERLLTPQEWPAEFVSAVRRIEYGSACAKINLALGELPRFRGSPTAELAPHHQATMLLGPTLEQRERAYDDAKYGWPSTEPILEMTLPTSLDDSLAPPGKHVLSIFVQYAPLELAEGRHWDEIKEDFADRCLAVVARYAPNVPSAVEARQVLSPLDLEREFRLSGGDIHHGALLPQQLYSLRPVAGWADHHTPVTGLFLCGAATHPGGGVWGQCGRNAATEILRA